MPGSITIRLGTIDDAPAIAAIYNQGIEDGTATFETRPRTPADIVSWFNGTHPVVVAHDGDAVLGFAAASAYRPRDCYRGVAEFSVYVSREARGRGVGRLCLAGLIDAAAAAGFWKLLSRIFPDNAASLALVRQLGFREVGFYRKHAQLHGVWRDVVIVERLLVDDAP